MALSLMLSSPQARVAGWSHASQWPDASTEISLVRIEQARKRRRVRVQAAPRLPRAAGRVMVWRPRELLLDFAAEIGEPTLPGPPHTFTDLRVEHTYRGTDSQIYMLVEYTFWNCDSWIDMWVDYTFIEYTFRNTDPAKYMFWVYFYRVYSHEAFLDRF